jgi:hypothetical protein
MTNDKFRIHLISSNGMCRNHQAADSPKDRMQLLKYAIFYLVVAAILFVTHQAAKNPMAGANQSQSPSNLHIDSSVARKLEPNRLAAMQPGEERTLFASGSRIMATNRFSILHPRPQIAPWARSFTGLLPI